MRDSESGEAEVTEKANRLKPAEHSGGSMHLEAGLKPHTEGEEQLAGLSSEAG